MPFPTFLYRVTFENPARTFYVRANDAHDAFRVAQAVEMMLEHLHRIREGRAFSRARIDRVTDPVEEHGDEVQQLIASTESDR